MRLLALALLVACKTASPPPPTNSTPYAPVVTAMPTRGVAQLAISEGSVCARMADGTVRCWGENTGDGTREERHTPVAVPGLTDVVDIFAGLAQTCARRTNGQVLCWGSTSFLDIEGDSSDTLVPTPAKKLANVNELWSSTHGAACARWKTGETRCWGFGGGSIVNGAMELVPELANATQISIGQHVGCARMRDGTAMCWGTNQYGELGVGDTKQHGKPMKVRGLTRVAQIAAARESVCAVREDATVWCWGDNRVGQLGDGTDQGRTRPQQVPGLVDVVEVTAGDLHNCARHRDGRLTCWGWNHGGQSGAKGSEDAMAPTRVAGIDRVVQVVAAWTHTCALREDGEVFCWGNGWRGVIGDGMQASRSAPTQVKWRVEQRPSTPLPPGIRVTHVGVSSSHTCAVLSDGSVRCWGDNSMGQVTGTGKNVDREEPITVPAIVPVKNATAVSIELFRSYARLADGRVVQWGPEIAVEDAGMPLVDELVSRSITCTRRMDVVTCVDDGKRATIGNVASFAMDNAHACVLLKDRTVQCAGLNHRGQLGDGTVGDRLKFAPVPQLADVAQVVVGTEHTCVRHLDHTVSCWGHESELGVETTDGTRPVKLQLADVVDLFAGGAATCAKLRTGEVSCWGNFAFGDPSTTPVLVPWLANAKSLVLGMSHSCVLHADDSLACWGENKSGQLGDGTMAVRHVATPVRW